MTGLLSPILRRPLVCLAGLWAGGILLANGWVLPWGLWAALAAVCLLVWGLLTCRTGRTGRPALALAVMAVAGAVTAWQDPPLTPDDPRFLPVSGVAVTGYLLEPATASPQGWTATFRLSARRVGQQWVPARGDVALLGRETLPLPGRYLQVLAEVLPAETPGNPYGFSWPAYLAEHGLSYRLLVRQVTPLPSAAPFSPFFHLRHWLASRLATSMTGTAYGALYAQLLGGLVLGVHGEPLPEVITEQFRQAGTIHVMIVSGSQLALLAGVLLFPLGVLPRGQVRTTYPRLRLGLVVLSLPLLALYVALADRGPAVDRALLMVLLSVLSLFLAFSPLARQRSYRPDGMTLLAAAALVVLVSRPAMLFNAGMQLSFAAVFGLHTVTPVLTRLFRRPLGPLTVWPAATWGAQSMTLPVLAWHFGTLPVFAPLTNLVALPLVALLLPLGVLTVACAALAPPAAVVLNVLNVPLLHGLVGASALAANSPWAQVNWYVRTPWPILAYLVGIALVLLTLARWLDRAEQVWHIPAGREPRMW